MFCPNCHAEFREGFTHCSECNVPLVAALPPEEVPEELEVVLTTSDGPTMVVAKSILDGADIPYITRGEEVLGIFPGLQIGSSEIQSGDIAGLLVPKDRAEEAREMLKEVDLPPESETPDEEDDSDDDDSSNDESGDGSYNGHQESNDSGRGDGAVL
jgi:hypothetical protein